MQYKEETLESHIHRLLLCRLRLFPLFIDPQEADWMFEQLQREIPWRQKSNIGPGKLHVLYLKSTRRGR